MKRKKWSEVEEQTLLTKYSDLSTSGTLAKLKTREKKFKPIADYINSVHNLHDPINFPFKWSWRDVSIKVQNMRHQYLGVKQKIRVSDDEFNWIDGQNHWENFLKYKEVFGDVELEVRDRRNGFGLDCGFEDFGGFGMNCDDLDEDDGELGEEERDPDGDFGFKRFRKGFGGDLGVEEGDPDGGLRFKRFRKGFDGELGGEEGDPDGDLGFKGVGKGFGVDLGGEERDPDGDLGLRRVKKSFDGELGRFGVVGSRILALRGAMLRREERRREREERRDEDELRREMGVEIGEMEVEDFGVMWGRRELRLERELEEERQRRIEVEEKRAEEDMEWRERMVGLQMEHEKQMMQMHADACHNQMQVLGVMTRLVCHFFGSGSDGLGGGLGAIPSQVLQNLQHSSGLGDDVKAPNSPSEFL